MNWLCSVRDAYRPAGNSAAHSPPMPGCRAATFGTRRDYLAMASPLRTGNSLIGTSS
jgi:hypothetical protein